MPYKVFLVEDEIVAREGIRDHIDWPAAGFEFCGEAPDGEIALPLIQAAQPDILITDIRMPFLDGLQLCQIVRRRLPHVKIIILSGYDDFQYAQEAIKLGVTEYLLKPIGAQNLLDALNRVAAQIDAERRERASRQALELQAQGGRALLSEKFLLRLLLQGMPAAEALETSRQLGIDLVAPAYLAIFIATEMSDEYAGQFDYVACQRAKEVVFELIAGHPGVLPLTKGIEEVILILKGEHPEQVSQEGGQLSRLIKDEVERKTRCRLTIGIGSPKERLEEISQSFLEAMASARNAPGEIRTYACGSEANPIPLPRFDRSAVENYLKCGDRTGLSQFIASYLQQFDAAALRSRVFRNYVVVDAMLTAANFVDELGGDAREIVPQADRIGELLAGIHTVDQAREQIRSILVGALEFRDSRVSSPHARMITQARDYIGAHYADPELSLRSVAQHVSLSPSHFSAVFSREAGETFRQCLTRVRVDRARELLRTTVLKVFEIAYQVGYSDPHYFSSVFKKVTGLSPTEFRARARPDRESAGDR